MAATQPGAKRRRRLDWESLEDRAVPATFGVPWSDPGHLTLSFVPDGTAVAGHTSSLFQLLDARQPTADWQRAVLRAFQTWAVNANVNLGLVADGGQALGVAGKVQHDARFGDVRVGAQAMSTDVLSVSVPNDAAVAGTLSGDVLVNTADKFDGKSMDLFSVLLHEAGHVFGLDDSTDVKSAMYAKYLGNNKLSPADVSSLQALYGTRTADPNEGSGGNDTIARATTIPQPGGYTGATPLIAYGDVTTNKDVDVFAFRAPSGYQGAATVRLQSAGVSLLTTHLSVLDGNGKVLGDALAATGFGDTVSVRLPALAPNATYYVKVQGATNDVFGIGGYGLAVTFDGRSRVTPAALDAVLRGPYQSLSASDVATIFTNPSQTFFNKGHGSDDPLAPTTLVSSPGYARNSHYEVVGSLTGPAGLTYYRIQTADAPARGKPLVLTVTVNALVPNGATPRVSILDRDGNPVASQVLANGNGTFTVQAVGIKAGGNYLLKVGPSKASGSPVVGNYALTAQFNTAPANFAALAAGTLTAASASQSYNFYVGQSQLMQLALSADAAGVPAPPGAVVGLDVLDKAGRVVLSLSAAAGDVVTGPAVFLSPGAYTIRFTEQVPAGTALVPLAYRLVGEGISDPIGPVAQDVTLAPEYTAPALPGWFLYPGGVITTTPFFVPPTPISPVPGV